ncbi:MAG: hypothetical protein GX490_01565 [Bacilli bacterium]|nr:hypothetical protein [Bacilli bacterium]
MVNLKLLQADVASFFDAAGLLYKYSTDAIKTENYTDGAKYFITSMINFSLASELALKYILLKREVSFSATSNIADLYNLLPNDDKQFIKNVLKPFIGNQEDDYVDKSIRNLKDTFLNWSNFSEYSREIDVNFFLIFTTVICQIVINDQM